MTGPFQPTGAPGTQVKAAAHAGSAQSVLPLPSSSVPLVQSSEVAPELDALEALDADEALDALDADDAEVLLDEADELDDELDEVLAPPLPVLLLEPPPAPPVPCVPSKTPKSCEQPIAYSAANSGGIAIRAGRRKEDLRS